MLLMEVESNPAGPHVATRFGRAVPHDNGGVFWLQMERLSTQSTRVLRCAMAWSWEQKVKQ
jgi:hypothetical protein